jgi:hypothetical protein
MPWKWPPSNLLKVLYSKSFFDIAKCVPLSPVMKAYYLLVASFLSWMVLTRTWLRACRNILLREIFWGNKPHGLWISSVTISSRHRWPISLSKINPLDIFALERGRSGLRILAFLSWLSCSRRHIFCSCIFNWMWIASKRRYPHMSNTHSKSTIMNVRASMNSNGMSLLHLCCLNTAAPRTLVLLKECGLLHQFVYFKHTNLFGTRQCIAPDIDI